MINKITNILFYVILIAVDKCKWCTFFTFHIVLSIVALVLALGVFTFLLLVVTVVIIIIIIKMINVFVQISLLL